MITEPYKDVFNDKEKVQYVCAKGYTLHGNYYNQCIRGRWAYTIRCGESLTHTLKQLLQDPDLTKSPPCVYSALLQ